MTSFYKWKLISTSPSIFLYGFDTERSKYRLCFNRENCTCDYRVETFITKEGMWEPQQKETNEWVKWSAKYGHWQVVDPTLDIEVCEFILSILQTIQYERGLK